MDWPQIVFSPTDSKSPEGQYPFSLLECAPEESPVGLQSYTKSQYITANQVCVSNVFGGSHQNLQLCFPSNQIQVHLNQVKGRHSWFQFYSSSLFSWLTLYRYRLTAYHCLICSWVKQQICKLLSIDSSSNEVILLFIFFFVILFDIVKVIILTGICLPHGPIHGTWNTLVPCLCHSIWRRSLSSYEGNFLYSYCGWSTPLIRADSSPCHLSPIWCVLCNYPLAHGFTLGGQGIITYPGRCVQLTQLPLLLSWHCFFSHMWLLLVALFESTSLSLLAQKIRMRECRNLA